MDITRREFVAGAAVAAACLTCGGHVVVAAEGADTTLDAGDLKSFKPGVNDKFIKSHKVAIVRKGDTVFASSAICTHKACTLKAAEGELRCGCHGSRFDLDGTATRGPAKDALPRYGVEAKDGKLIVDLKKIVLPGDFEKEGSSVKV